MRNLWLVYLKLQLWGNQLYYYIIWTLDKKKVFIAFVCLREKEGKWEKEALEARLRGEDFRDCLRDFFCWIYKVWGYSSKDA